MFKPLKRKPAIPAAINDALIGIIGHFESNKGDAVFMVPEAIDSQCVLVRLAALSDNCSIEGMQLVNSHGYSLWVLKENCHVTSCKRRLYLLDRAFYSRDSKQIELHISVARLLKDPVLTFSKEQY